MSEIVLFSKKFLDGWNKQICRQMLLADTKYSTIHLKSFVKTDVKQLCKDHKTAVDFCQSSRMT